MKFIPMGLKSLIKLLLKKVKFIQQVFTKLNTKR